MKRWGRGLRSVSSCRLKIYPEEGMPWLVTRHRPGRAGPAGGRTMWRWELAQELPGLGFLISKRVIVVIAPISPLRVLQGLYEMIDVQIGQSFKNINRHSHSL